jgi:hypothetical protein
MYCFPLQSSAFHKYRIVQNFHVCILIQLESTVIFSQALIVHTVKLRTQHYEANLKVPGH